MEAWDRELKNKLADGKLETIDNQIDPTTGTLKLRAVFDNSNGKLFPSQFVNARLLVEQKQNITLLPNAAIQRNSQGTYVWLVNPDQTVTVRPVTVGTTEGDQSEITSGLEPGDTVVTVGVDRLEEGGKVNAQVPGKSRQTDGEAAASRAARQWSGQGNARRRTIAQSSIMRHSYIGHESFSDIHCPAGSHFAVDGRDPAGRRRRLQAIAGVRAAGSGLSHHPGDHVLSGRESGRDGIVGYRAARTPVRPGARTAADDLHQLRRQLGHHARIQFEFEHRRRRAGGAAIHQCIRHLSAGGPADPPIYAKVNPADTPILTLALTSDALPLSKVEDLADTRLAPKISQLPGVGLVSISGGQKPAVRIQANPTALASYGLNLEDLRNAITAANVNQAKGNFDGAHQAYQIGANDQLLSSADYAPLIIAYRNNGPVRVSDVATVVDDTENVRQAAWMNETPAVIVNIQRQPGANIIAVVDRIKALLPQLHASLPSSIQVKILTDRTNTIRASVSDVQFELMLTIGLVVLVIFLFLRNLSATVIPSIAVPLVAGRHVRRDVSARLQPEQSIADGADHFHRLRGGRRDRDDREHFALSGGGQTSAPGGAARLRADRVHHRLADRFADRGADSAAVHGRHRGPAVPRIRGDAERNHSGVGRGLADADADDVRQDFEAHARAASRAGFTAPPSAASRP